MKQLIIANGEILLDGEKIQCLKKYNIACSAKDKGIAELTVCMDVFIGSSGNEEAKKELENSKDKKAR